MKALLLAAGYGTRLGDLGERYAKALLPLEGPDSDGPVVLDHIVRCIQDVAAIDELYIVTNEKYYDRFLAWRSSVLLPVKLINDGSTCNDNRLGAIRDMQLGLEQITDDVLVLAGDNVFDFSLLEMYEEFKTFGSHTIAVYDAGSKEIVRNKHGVAVAGQGSHLVGFEEKPSEPKSTLKSICCYMFKKGVVSYFDEYLKEGNPDATGYFLEWFVPTSGQVYMHKFDGRVIDVGKPEVYAGLVSKFKKTGSLF
ncbi:NTP transferase domain-containing protein [Candidatus Woesearchaeota archaeon]|nr:NTP transferase domain-containing protein [Candidatus Woesearchaeota archaeon]